MALVWDYYDGSTHIQVYDDCCVKTKEEVDAILERVGEIYMQSELTRIRAEQAEEEKRLPTADTDADT